MITTVLFDLGNVLETHLPRSAFESELTQLAEEYGLTDGKAFWYHFYVCDAYEAVKRGKISRSDFWAGRFSALGVTDTDEQQALWERIFQYMSLYPKMHSALDTLRDANIPMSILSNTVRKDLRSYLDEAYGIGHYFEHVISSAQIGHAKPDPEIYTHTIDTLGRPPAEILFIDDQERNTLPAEAAGMTTIIFNTPSQTLAQMKTYGLPL